MQETIFDEEPEPTPLNPLKKPAPTPIDLEKFEQIDDEVLEREEDQGQ
jgi:hypothetical protein